MNKQKTPAQSATYSIEEQIERTKRAVQEAATTPGAPFTPSGLMERIACAIEVAEGQAHSREAQLVKTKLEEALMWAARLP